MDSREVQGPATAAGGLPVQQPQMLMGPASSPYHSNSAMISANPATVPHSSTRFPFNSITSPPPPLLHHQQNQQQPQLKALDSLSPIAFDGSSQFRYNTEPTMKKKRGRPRKYAPDGNIALQLAPTTSIASNSNNHGGGDSVVGLANSGAASEPPAKRNRGRPPGSGKRQIDALGGTGGVGFTPHVITVKSGEDIAAKIMAFSQQGPRMVCILSANGAICDVTLRQPSNVTAYYEGRYEIISLSGSFLISENNRYGGLNVSLAGSDGKVVGGGVAGVLQAASPVQIIVGSFIADGRKLNADIFRSGPSLLTSNMLNFGAPGATGSPPSQGGTSDSSDGHGSSPLHREHMYYNNSASSLHNNNMQMFWTGHNPQ